MAASEDQNRLNSEQTQDSELEQYGVWVKAGPEDVDESEAEDESFTLTDLAEEEFDEAEMDLLGTDEHAEPTPADELEEELDLSDLDLDEEPEASQIPALDQEDVSVELPEEGEAPEPRPEAAQPEPAQPEPGQSDTEEFPETGDEAFTIELEDDLDELETGSEPAEQAPESEPRESSGDAAELEEELEEELEGELEEAGEDEFELEPLDELELEEPSGEPAAPNAEPAPAPESASEATGEPPLEASAESDELDLDMLEPEPTQEGLEGGGIDIEDELPGDLDDLTLDLDSLDVDAYGEPTSGEEQTDASDTEEPGTGGEQGTENDLDQEIAQEAESITLESGELSLEEDELDLESLELGDDTEVAELDLSSLPGEEEEFETLSPEDVSQQSEDELPELELDDDLGLDEGFDDLQAVEEEMTAQVRESQTEDQEPAEEPAGMAEPSQSPGIPDETTQLESELPPGFEDSQEFETIDLEAPEPAGLGQEQSTGASTDESRSLLESIERELSSIRTELTDLRSELATLRSGPAATSPSESSVEPSSEAEPGGGFFEDEGDEDETIALTGAELDNIMNTAEFTEQPGRPTDVEDLMPQEDSSPIQEITLEEAPEEAGELDLDLTSQEPREETPPAEPGIFGGTDEDIETLAGLDIDAELADIDELGDDTHEPEPADVHEPEPADTHGPEPLDIDSAEEGPYGNEPESPETGESAAEETPAIPDEALPLGEEEPQLPEDQPFELGDEVQQQVESIGDAPIPENIKGELRSVLNYMDKLLDSLPEEKIQEFAASEHFKVYKRLFEELGLEQ